MGNTEQSSRGVDSPNVVIMQPGVFLACLVSGIALEAVLPTGHEQACALSLVAGALVFVIGFAFMMWGHGRFTKLGVNVKTILPASRLVCDGAYRFSRNPMYVGFLLMIGGLGIAAVSVWICAMILPFFTYLRFYVIPREEGYLSRRFGVEYATYCGRVRRWL